nr:hypothetical protein [Tanacetum cinerariifolium]
MTSITAQQTKLDLELVPKENRLDIGKCNTRIPCGLKQKVERFQVVLDTLALTLCYPAFVITAHVPEIYMYQFWNSVYKHHNFYRFKIDKKKRFKLTLEESKAYKTYLGYATGTVPPKVARNFKKASPSKKDSVPVSADEEPVQKGERVKRSAKKSSTTLTTGIVIKEHPVETQSKRKEKVDVTRGKGSDLLSEVALTEEAQIKEVRKKSLRDFYKSHPSGSGSVAKKPPSVEKITPPVIKSWGNDKDDNNDENNSNEDKDEENKSDDDEPPSNSEKDDDDKSEGDEDIGMDSDDVQDKKADVGMTDAQQEKENLEITQEQVIEDAHLTITKKTEVPVTSSSRSSDLASKFLNFLDIPPADTEILSPLDIHVHHEVPRIHASTLLDVPVLVIPEASPVYTNIPQSSQTFTSSPLQSTPSPLPITKTTNIPPSILDFASVFRFNDGVIALEKDVAELKNDPLHTQVTALVDDHLDTRMGATKEEFMNFLSASLTDRITEQRSRYDMDKDEGPFVGSGRGSSKGTKSQPKSSGKSAHVKEPEFENMSLKNATALLEKLDWENPEGGDYSFDLSKPLPLNTRGNRQSIPVEFFINNDLKYLLGGTLTMTYTTSTTKRKATQYDLPGIEDIVPNIWSPVKVSYDIYALWVTHVSVMRKHRYGYLEEIVVRRADNKLYKFKEGDFARIRINDIEDMLLLVVQNYLTNHLGDDVSDFAIALRMFTRSLRNRLMRSDKLYKFSDGTLTRLLSLLEDISKNIDMEYLPKRRWSTLEKKRAHCMIKDINKLLKEKRMMRSLEKFVGGRLYRTDLRLLQRTI